MSSIELYATKGQISISCQQLGPKHLPFKWQPILSYFIQGTPWAPPSLHHNFVGRAAARNDSIWMEAPRKRARKKYRKRPTTTSPMRTQRLRGRLHHSGAAGSISSHDMYNAGGIVKWINFILVGASCSVWVINHNGSHCAHSHLILQAERAQFSVSLNEKSVVL